MIRNNFFWANYIKTVFLPGIEFFSRCMLEKVIPSFDNVEDEADEIEREAFENPGGLADPEFYDPADHAEGAFEKGLEYYEWMIGTLQGIINLFTAGLYHLFEQQFLFIYRRELLQRHEENDPNFLKFGIAKQRFSDQGIRIEDFGSWPKVNELRLLANTVQHADGVSATDLKAKRPDLFSRPDNRLVIKLNRPPGPVYTPLTGNEIYVTKEEYLNYVNAVKEFWGEMASALEGQGHGLI